MKRIKIQSRSPTLIDRGYPLVFIIPAAFFFVMFFIVPVIMGFVFSFTNWNLRNPEIEFVGLYQFKTLLNDDLARTSFINTFIFAGTATVVQNILGLILAMIMFQKMKTGEFIQTVFFLPYILSILIVGYAFKAILHPTGLLNNLLTTIGLESLTQDWLIARHINLMCIIAVFVWMEMGFTMTIYLTGLKNISSDVLEASRIDGANGWQRFKDIIFPLLAPAFTINVLWTFIISMKVFDLVLALTKGGPGFMTEVINGMVFRMFGRGQLAYGTSASVVLFIFITIGAVFILRYLRRREIDA